MTAGLFVVIVLAIVVIVMLAKTAVVVPQQSAYVVERLGKYRTTLDAGFHILMPFPDRVRYKHSLKEQALDIPEQQCITRDNVQVAVDGVMGYTFAIPQLAQTTLRSEMGKIEPDRTSEERTAINAAVVTELDKATEPWGVKVLRYEIKNLTPPADVVGAMEKQMRAECEK
jgi:regulator of protease activity HflC (stomatin/prohibitin superfamily)